MGLLRYYLQLFSKNRVIFPKSVYHLGFFNIVSIKAIYKKLVGDHPCPTLKNGPTHILFPPPPKS